MPARVKKIKAVGTSSVMFQEARIWSRSMPQESHPNTERTWTFLRQIWWITWWGSWSASLTLGNQIRRDDLERIETSAKNILLVSKVPTFLIQERNSSLSSRMILKKTSYKICTLAAFSVEITKNLLCRQKKGSRWVVQAKLQTKWNRNWKMTKYWPSPWPTRFRLFSLLVVS